MRATDGETKRRSKEANDGVTTDVDVWSNGVGRFAHQITNTDGSWLDTIGDWLGSIGDALESLDLGFDW